MNWGCECALRGRSLGEEWGVGGTAGNGVLVLLTLLMFVLGHDPRDHRGDRGARARAAGKRTVRRGRTLLIPPHLGMNKQPCPPPAKGTLSSPGEACVWGLLQGSGQPPLLWAAVDSPHPACSQAEPIGRNMPDWPSLPVAQCCRPMGTDPGMAPVPLYPTIYKQRLCQEGGGCLWVEGSRPQEEGEGL